MVASFPKLPPPKVSRSKRPQGFARHFGTARRFNQLRCKGMGPAIVRDSDRELPLPTQDPKQRGVATMSAAEFMGTLEESGDFRVIPTVARHSEGTEPKLQFDGVANLIVTIGNLL
jgi:hypothetical protein